MPPVGFELTILEFERPKTVRALDRAAIGTGATNLFYTKIKILRCCYGDGGGGGAERFQKLRTISEWTLLLWLPPVQSFKLLGIL
jgi:hypothetical protein